MNDISNIVVVATLKGGAGKTTVTANLSAMLASGHVPKGHIDLKPNRKKPRKSRRVLLIDLDPQCNLSSDLGVPIESSDLKTVQDIFESARLDIPAQRREVDPETLVLKGVVEGIPTLDIIPSSISLIMTEMVLSNLSSRELIMKRYIEKHAEFFSQYDHIIIDTNPNIGIINQNAFIIADSIILVSDISYNGIQGSELFLYMWDSIRENMQLEDNVKALIINNFDRRLSLSNDLKEYCKQKETFEDLLITETIPTAVVFKNASCDKEPVCIYEPNHRALVALSNVLDELEKRGVF